MEAVAEFVRLIEARTHPDRKFEEVITGFCNMLIEPFAVPLKHVAVLRAVEYCPRFAGIDL